jgi:hypothetical protein
MQLLDPRHGSWPQRKPSTYTGQQTWRDCSWTGQDPNPWRMFECLQRYAPYTVRTLRSANYALTSLNPTGKINQSGVSFSFLTVAANNRTQTSVTEAYWWLITSFGVTASSPPTVPGSFHIHLYVCYIWNRYNSMEQRPSWEANSF